MYACIVFVVVFGFPFRVFQIRLLKSFPTKSRISKYIYSLGFFLLLNHIYNFKESCELI